MKIKILQKGVSIYLAIVIMFILLSIGLGISTLLVGQIRIIRGMGYSVVALYAADTGIERVLFEIRKNNYTPGALPDYPFGPTPVIMNNGATYAVKIISANGTFTINSIGAYQGTNRAIEISY